MVDLRNRDSYEEIVNDLKSVPSQSYSELARRLGETAATELAMDKEAMVHRTNLMEREARDRMAKCGKTTGAVRIHAFSIVGPKSYTFRLNSDDGSNCFSNFVSKVDIIIAPSNESVAWSRNDEPIDGLTLTRPNPLSGDVVIEVSLHVNYKNCLYYVPSWLAGNQGRHMTFVELFKAICAYIKVNNLSSNDDPSYFTPDAVIHDTLYPNHPKELPVSFASLLEAIRSRFKAPGPFKIVHKIGSAEQVFDLIVQLPDQTDDEEGRSSKILNADQKLAGKLMEIEEELSHMCSGIKGTGEDAHFLDKLALNPAGFLNEILRMPTGVPGPVESAGLVDYLSMTTSHEFYKQPWAVASAAYVVNEQKKASAI